MVDKQVITPSIKSPRGRSRRASKRAKDQEFRLDMPQDAYAEIAVHIDFTLPIERSACGGITMDMSELERLIELIKIQMPTVRKSEIKSKTITIGTSQASVSVVVEASSRGAIAKRLATVHASVADQVDVAKDATDNLEHFAAANHHDDERRRKKIAAALRKENRVSKINTEQPIGTEIAIEGHPRISMEIGKLKAEDVQSRLRILGSQRASNRQTYTVQVTRLAGDRCFFATSQSESAERRYKLQPGIDDVVVGQLVQITVDTDRKRDVNYYQLVLWTEPVS